MSFAFDKCARYMWIEKINFATLDPYLGTDKNCHKMYCLLLCFTQLIFIVCVIAYNVWREREMFNIN